MVDPRTVVGNKVSCKARLVTHISECSRRYGANAFVQIVYGVVIETVIERKDGKTRGQKMVIADYNLGSGTIKRAKVNIRNLLHVPDVVAEAVPANDNMEVDNDVVAAIVNENETIPGNVIINNNDNNQTNNNNNNDTTVTVNELIDDTTIGTIEEARPMDIIVSPTRRNDRSPTRPRVIFSPQSNRPLRPGTLVHVANDTNWYIEPEKELEEVNGPFPYRQWGIRTATGEVIGVGSNTDDRYSRLDVFLMMFPDRAMTTIIQQTNIQLRQKNKTTTNHGELLKFFGVILLTSKFEFTKRAQLWSGVAGSKYERSAEFGRTGMSRNRFDDLWSNIRFSYQPPERPETQSSENYRWMLIDDFISSFNEHRERKYIPSEFICVDESMSRWYGQGGDWINHGLPMYVAIDRKPENGCEIQDACCGVTGIMIRLKVVKSKNEQEEQQENGTEDMLHGTQVLRELVYPWRNTERVVCADSYFASVKAVEELRRLRLRFIGVVKTATRRYPMAYLNTYELGTRGDRHALVKKNDIGDIEMLAFVWMDRERRYFIASAGSMSEGEPFVRQRWRQVDQTANASPDQIQLIVPQPKAVEIYYKVCGKVDQHNRDRQDTLGLEKKLKTNDWSMRVNLTILSMVIVDTWRAWSHMADNTETQKEFYGHLATELIDNNYNNVGGRGRRQQSEDDADASGNMMLCGPIGGVGPHITPTKFLLTNKNGEKLNHRRQGRCRTCGDKTTHHCSACIDSPEIKDLGWICNTKTGKSCFAEHLVNAHP
jgi:hypothetical protein